MWPVCLLFHLSLLLWPQGDSPGPVQKNLHNPIVQVGVPSPGSSPAWPCPHPLFPWALGIPPSILGHPKQRGVKKAHVVGARVELPTWVCPFVPSLDL